MIRRTLSMLIVLLFATSFSSAQEPSPSLRLGAGSKRIAELPKRLEALSPAAPRAYLELGEEVASESADDVDRRLARQLYVLAFELDRRSKFPDPQLGGSVCLALAAVAESDDEKRWLTALAETLAPEGTPDMRRIKSTTASRDPAAFDLATMLSFVRIGEGRRAAKILEKPGVSELLDKCDKLLQPGIGGASRVRERIAEWPICSECRNHRTIKDATGVHLCPSCHGTPGPILPAGELVGHIRTESVLLSGQQRSWAGQLIADGGATLRELDPSELAATYGVSAARPVWRLGVWVADPSASAPRAAGDPKDQVAPGTAAPAEPASNPAGKRAG
jgi:hypothetical protein